jgi:hypothetical protein
MRRQQRLGHGRDRDGRCPLRASRTVPSDGRRVMAVTAGGRVDPGRRRLRRRRPACLPEGHAAEVPELSAARVAAGGRVPLVAGDRHGPRSVTSYHTREDAVWLCPARSLLF